VDNFKAINDRHGHMAGDTVIREVSRRMRTAVRGSDVVGRYGGKEFVVLA
jgi:diguanylate cyclase (GGDEF)-like protein